MDRQVAVPQNLEGALEYALNVIAQEVSNILGIKLKKFDSIQLEGLARNQHLKYQMIHTQDEVLKCLRHDQSSESTKFFSCKSQETIDLLNSFGQLHDFYREWPFQLMYSFCNAFEINQKVDENFEAYTARRQSLVHFFRTLYDYMCFITKAIEQYKDRAGVDPSKAFIIPVALKIFKDLWIAVDDESIWQLPDEKTSVASMAYHACMNLASRLGCWNAELTDAIPESTKKMQNTLVEIAIEVNSCLELQIQTSYTTNKREISILILLLSNGELDKTWEDVTKRNLLQEFLMQAFEMCPEGIVPEKYNVRMHNLVVFMNTFRYRFTRCIEDGSFKITHELPTERLVTIMRLLQWMIYIANNNPVKFQNFSLDSLSDAQVIYADIIQQKMHDCQKKVYGDSAHQRLIEEAVYRIVQYGLETDVRNGKELNVISMLENLVLQKFMQYGPNDTSHCLCQSLSKSGATSFDSLNIRIIFHLIQQMMNGDFIAHELHLDMAQTIMDIFRDMHQFCEYLYEIIIQQPEYQVRGPAKYEVIEQARRETYSCLSYLVEWTQSKDKLTQQYIDRLTHFQRKFEDDDDKTEIWNRVSNNPDAKFMLDNFITSSDDLSSLIDLIFDLPLARHEAIPWARLLLAADGLSVHQQVFLADANKKNTISGKLQKLSRESGRESVLVPHFLAVQRLTLQPLHTDVIMNAIKYLSRAESDRYPAVVVKQLRTIFIILPWLFAYHCQEVNAMDIKAVFEHKDEKHCYPTLLQVIDFVLGFIVAKETYIPSCRQIIFDIPEEDKQQLCLILSIYMSLHSKDPHARETISQLVLPLKFGTREMMQKAYEVALKTNNPMSTDLWHRLDPKVPMCKPFILSNVVVRYVVSNILGDSYIELPDNTSRVYIMIMLAKLRFLFMIVPNIYAYSLQNSSADFFNASNGNYPSLRIIIRVLFETVSVLELIIPEIKNIMGIPIKNLSEKALKSATSSLFEPTTGETLKPPTKPPTKPTTNEVLKSAIEFCTWLFGGVSISDMQQLCRILDLISSKKSITERQMADRLNRWCKIISSIPGVKGIGFDDNRDTVAFATHNPMAGIPVIDIAFFMIYGNTAEVKKQKLSLRYKIDIRDESDQRNQEFIKGVKRALESMLNTTCITLVYKRLDKGHTKIEKDFKKTLAERGKIVSREIWTNEVTDFHRILAIFSLFPDLPIELIIDYEQIQPSVPEERFSWFMSKFISTLSRSVELIELYMQEIASMCGCQQNLEDEHLKKVLAFDEHRRLVVPIKQRQITGPEQPIAVIPFEMIPAEVRKILLMHRDEQVVWTYMQNVFYRFINTTDSPLIFLVRLRNAVLSIMQGKIGIPEESMLFENLGDNKILKLGFRTPVPLRNCLNGSDATMFSCMIHDPNAKIKWIVFLPADGQILLLGDNIGVPIVPEALNMYLGCLYEILSRHLYAENKVLINELITRGYVDIHTIPAKLLPERLPAIPISAMPRRRHDPGSREPVGSAAHGYLHIGD